MEGRIHVSRMRCHSIYKVPQGKLLKISLTYDQSTRTIHQVRITGDFFAYPEEAVEYIEQGLENAIFERDLLKTKIESIICSQKIEFIGVDAEGLTRAILDCKP